MRIRGMLDAAGTFIKHLARARRRLALAVVAALAALAVSSPWWSARVRSDHATEARQRVAPRLDAELRALGSSLGSPVFIRIFKQPPVLELWARTAQDFALFKKYPICRFSGTLGPKTSEGDRQAPEGLYTVGTDQLNPRSRFYLALNLGYPNALEIARGWTGDALMIHGNCVSIGCYAMGDDAIAEIYTAAAEALRSGQDSVPVHAFPFPLDARNLAMHAQSPSSAYWQELVSAYEAFEHSHVPPRVTVTAHGYQLSPM
jgi:murein L,D-transpeptidase YafK